LAIRGVKAVKGTWQDDHAFVIDRLILGQGKPAERWTLKFDGEKLNVRFNTNFFSAVRLTAALLPGMLEPNAN
jgi:short-subunit dehydrogenase